MAVNRHEDAVVARATELRAAATRRWLVKDELMFLLLNYTRSTVPLEHTLQMRPASGTLMMYNVTDVPDFKKDGWRWQKRKDNSGRVRAFVVDRTASVREDRAKLVINREIIILGTYVHSEEILTFHRRNYYLRDSNQHIMLVHYFDEVYKADPSMGAFLAAFPRRVGVSPKVPSNGHKGVKRSLPSLADGTSAAMDVNPPRLPMKMEQWNTAHSVKTIVKDCFAMDYLPNEAPQAYPQMSSTDFEMMKPTSSHMIPSFDEDVLFSDVPMAFTDPCDVVNPVEISDFSPDWDIVTGGAKILICLATTLQNAEGDVGDNNLFVQFGPNTRVPAVRISDTVIRCSAPPTSDPGDVDMYICRCASATSLDCLRLSSKQRFQFRSASNSTSPIQSGADQLESIDDPSSINTNGGKRSRSPTAALPSSRQHARAMGDNANRAPNSADSALFSAFVDTEFDERQCKIRVVERLSDFHDAIRSTSGAIEQPPSMVDSTMITNSSSHAPVETPTLSDQLDDTDNAVAAVRKITDNTLGLDDGAIDDLSDQDLESLSEELLERVVRQLVSIAHTNDELLEELNSLDEAGLSLLHYVSFYNYAHLIPVLLSHGAHVNQQSTQGHTPLHLAAGCGYQQVVDALVRAGADIFCLDFVGFTPADRAEKSGQGQVAAHLRQLMGFDARNESQFVEGAEWPITTDMDIDGSEQTAHSDSIDGSDGGVELCKGENEGGVETNSARPNSYVGENHEHNRKLLLGAFSTMSLHDKCALSLSISRDLSSTPSRRRGSSLADDPASAIVALASGSSTSSSPALAPASVNGAAPSNGMSTAYGDSSTDANVNSVMADNEENLNKLEAAMELMGDEELQSLAEEAIVIQHNVRAWLLRRNCRNMQKTTKRLHEAARNMEEQQKLREQQQEACEREWMSQQELSERERAAVTVQAAARTMLARKNFLQTRNVTIKVQAATRGVLCRKNFARIKSQALASLVIQRNIREWLSKQPSGVNNDADSTNEDVVEGSIGRSVIATIPNPAELLDIPNSLTSGNGRRSVFSPGMTLSRTVQQVRKDANIGQNQSDLGHVNESMIALESDTTQAQCSQSSAESWLDPPWH